MNKMKKRKNVDIFISYARKTGIQMAGRVRDVFVSKGYVVHMDIHDGKDNVDFRKEKEEVIKNCKDFVIILSGNAENDIPVFEREWVARELCWALKYKKNIISIKQSDFHFPKDDKGVTKKLQPPEILQDEFEENILNKLREWPKLNHVTAEMFEESESDYIFEKIDKRLISNKKRKKIRCIIWFCFWCLILFFPFYKVFNWGLEKIKLNKQQQLFVAEIEEINRTVTDGEWLSGTARESKNQFRNIKSILAKYQIENDMEVQLIMNDNTTERGVLHYVEDGKMKFEWDWSSELNGYLCNENIEVKNCFPNGFYIVCNNKVYDYSLVMDRTGKYDIKISNIQDVDLNINYKSVNSKNIVAQYVNYVSEVIKKKSDFGSDNWFHDWAHASWEKYPSYVSGTFDSKNIWAMVSMENELFFVRKLHSKKWEICGLGQQSLGQINQPGSTHLYSTSMGQKKYIIIHGYCKDKDSDREKKCIYVSDDFGGSFKRIVFDIPLSYIERNSFQVRENMEELCDSYSPIVETWTSGIITDQVFIKSSELSNEMIESYVLKCDLDGIFKGKVDYFEVEEKAYFPAE